MRKYILLAASLAVLGPSASAALTSAAQERGAPGQRPEAGKTELSRSDREFIEKAAQGGLLEVRLGRLAQQRAQSEEVKRFGQRMVDDHSAANDRLAAVAQRKGVNVPQELDDKHRGKVDKLSKKSGAEFDRDYMSEMVDDHEKDVREFERASREAKDPDVQRFAAETLPTLREHLTLAKDIHGRLKGK